MFVLVAGPPGSGKSTLARPLALELGLPLLAKDDVKEALMGEMGVPADVHESRRLGRAAVFAVFAVAAGCHGGAVIDSTFYAYTAPLVRALPGPVVEVRCVCPREVARERFAARGGQGGGRGGGGGPGARDVCGGRGGGRGPGHFDEARTEAELWDDHLAPLGLGPVIEVDTSGEVSVSAVARLIRERAT